MSQDAAADKARWRRRLRTILNGISPAEQDEASAHARELLRRQPAWQGAAVILFYAPLAGELDLTPLMAEALEAGKTVALPRFSRETGTYLACEVSDFAGDCAPGKFGIGEPGAHCAELSLKRLDLALVPGLGFDVFGRRLGRGRGFYDRLLAGIAGIKCGAAFDQQVVEQIPSERHDASMNFILTPTRWLTASEDFSTQS
ncbi:MAG TPA: 5-formyltetrahydrofolate cyclo-ligase [Verrucomicrobiae bacterium]|jgi:5-formyltetrahydrofolate cyclo-ligase